nr:MAG TPA: hypothetical protein [Caudoviricetes sp.]DAG55295.1 MAG TPA: hypothetical protein [Caudoviricetes sp.]
MDSIYSYNRIPLNQIHHRKRFMGHKPQSLHTLHLKSMQFMKLTIHIQISQDFSAESECCASSTC